MSQRVKLQDKGQITLPASIRAKLPKGTSFDVHELGNGQIVLHPVLTIEIDPEQSWFWTPQWQQLEREAGEDIAAGRVTRYGSFEEMIADFDGDS